ncbi:hypothetical protein [Chakrabartyella piscis]|uniref:COG1361 S-layer family protein n=1 Tax=Chakrabartyella piscis TaxID=2918914 RepID=UPI002958C0BB|nr:hypothetical protein [Chakrabartyella piscis]
MRTTNWKKLVTLLLMCVALVMPSITVYADTASIVVGGEKIHAIESGVDNTINLQVKNKGTGTTGTIFTEAVVSPTDPVRVQIKSGANISSLGQNAVADLTLVVKVTGEVKESTYPVTLNFTYNGYSTQDTIYLEMKDFTKEAQFGLTNMQMTPSSLSTGESGVLSGSIQNQSTYTMHDVNISLENLETTGISLASGFSNQYISEIVGGTSQNFNFQLATSTDMATGNYPVTILLTYKNQYGTVTEKTQQYYINVGGVSGQTSEVLIQNMVEPSGTYDVNENFTITFDLYNDGSVSAKDIIVTASPIDASAVVPKSNSMKTISELSVGESYPISFTFAGTAAANTQNHAIEFAVEYTSGGSKVHTTRQFAGVNVYNPDSDDTTESKPRIIVQEYHADPISVMAGEEFDLSMVLWNASSEKDVKNIKMYFSLAEETSSESETSGNVFIPVNSSNTFYFDEIPSRGTVDKSMRLYVVPEAQPKTYTLTVNFEYEDASGNEYTATELLGINVKQSTEIQMDDFAIPDMVEMYMPVNVSFGYYNTGRVTLNNVMVRVEGDVECDSKNTYIGNMETGDSEYYDVMFTPMTAGEVPVSIVISYEDATGEVYEERRDFNMNVMEPYMPEMDDMEMMPEEPPVDMKKMAISISLLAVGLLALFVFIKKQKGNMEDAHAYAYDDEEDEEDEEDDEEGMSL